MNSFDASSFIQNISDMLSSAMLLMAAMFFVLWVYRRALHKKRGTPEISKVRESFIMAILFLALHFVFPYVFSSISLIGTY